MQFLLWFSPVVIIAFCFFCALACCLQCFWPSVLWRYWSGGRKGIRPVKKLRWVAGVVICLEWGADLHMAQLMPLPLTVSCFSKIQIGLPFWYRLTRVVPDKGPLNVCFVCLFALACWLNRAVMLTYMNVMLSLVRHIAVCETCCCHAVDEVSAFLCIVIGSLHTLLYATSTTCSVSVDSARISYS